MRQKVRATGLDPNYWYAVEFADRIQPGQVLEVVFWKRSIALFRDIERRVACHRESLCPSPAQAHLGERGRLPSGVPVPWLEL